MKKIKHESKITFNTVVFDLQRLQREYEQMERGLIHTLTILAEHDSALAIKLASTYLPKAAANQAADAIHNIIKDR